MKTDEGGLWEMYTAIGMKSGRQASRHTEEAELRQPASLVDEQQGRNGGDWCYCGGLLWSSGHPLGGGELD